MSPVFLTREAILQADDLKFEDVEVAAWGGTVRVRALTASERDAFEAEAYLTNGPDREKNARNVRARLVVKSLINEQGERLFKDEEADLVGRKHGAVIDQLFWTARRLSAFTEEEVDALVKNSKPSPAGDASGA